MKMILFLWLVCCLPWCANASSGLYKCESMDSLINGIPPDTDCLLYIHNETILREYIQGNESRMTDLGCELDSPTVNLTECGQINCSIHHLKDALKNTTYYKNRSCMCTNGECTECGPVLCSGPSLTYNDAQTCMKKCEAFNCSLVEINPTPMISSTEDTTTVANTSSVKSSTTHIPAVIPPTDNPTTGLWGLIAVPILICGATVFLMWWRRCCCFRDQTPSLPPGSNKGSMQSNDDLSPLGKGNTTATELLQFTQDDQNETDPQNPLIQA